MTSARSARAIPIVLRGSELIPAVQNESRRNGKKPTTARFCFISASKGLLPGPMIAAGATAIKDSSINDIEQRCDCRNRQYRILDFHLTLGTEQCYRNHTWTHQCSECFPRQKNESSNVGRKPATPPP
jgi:hypothetical protein